MFYLATTNRSAAKSLHLLLLLLCAALSGCIGSRAVESSAEYLSPSGWRNNQNFLTNNSFADYANAVTDEVRRYRIPFESNNADTEIAMASPVELPLAAHCNSQENGIAILVHGLSDTAFSMRDIGSVLADVCYRSRVILLPGHGTKSGDLLTTRLSDWQDTLRYLIDQAATETDTILLVGFSLGGVLTLDAALQRENEIDGIIGISPAYYLSSENLTKLTPLLAPVIRWIDRGVADDAMRYEAMPTRGVAETWKAMKQARQNLEKTGPTNFPWMLAQSMDDAVVATALNEALWKTHAANSDSRLIRFVSTQEYPPEDRVVNLPGSSAADRVIALTHLAIHQSPDNPYYGKNGSYRNCGSNMPRAANQVDSCELSDSLWYGVWDTEPKPGQALAMSTFNPSFNQLAEEIKTFANKIANNKNK